MLHLLLALLLSASAAGQTIPCSPQTLEQAEAEFAAFRRLQLHDAARLRELAYTARILELKIQALEEQARLPAALPPPPVQQQPVYYSPQQLSPAEQEHRIYLEGVAAIRADAENERRLWSRPVPASYNPPPPYVPPPPPPETAEQRWQRLSDEYDRRRQEIDARYPRWR